MRGDCSLVDVSGIIDHHTFF